MYYNYFGTQWVYKNKNKMLMKSLLVLSFLFVALLSYGCKEDTVSDGEVRRPTSQECIEVGGFVCFIYETLNTQGEPDSTFAEGENIIVSFRVVNSSTVFS